jgi:hypothetical protein
MHYDWRRQRPYTNICRHTGLTIPECSCPVCIEAQIARDNLECGRASGLAGTSSGGMASVSVSRETASRREPDVRTKARTPRRRRTIGSAPALVIAFIAMFVAIGGVGYSALQLKPNAVKTKNIKAAAVTTSKLAPGAVTNDRLHDDAVSGPKVAPGSLSPSDITGVAQVVARGTLPSPGLIAAAACGKVSRDVPGVQAGDMIVVTPPLSWPTLQTSVTGAVSDGAVHYTACGLTATDLNFGTAEDVKFMVLR